MRTAIIWWEIPEEIKFFAVDGDLREFNGKFINVTDMSEEFQQRMLETFYEEDGSPKLVPITLEEFRKEIQDGAELIHCGFHL